jgi:hypothetical protein
MMRPPNCNHLFFATIYTIMIIINSPTVLASPTSTNMSMPPQDGTRFMRRDMTAGSSCSEEGQWYCMGTSWQRCAAGQWSVTMQCAEGTQCTPSGLSYDFAVEESDGIGTATSGTSTAIASSTDNSRRRYMIATSTVTAMSLTRDWWHLAVSACFIGVLLI